VYRDYVNQLAAERKLYAGETTPGDRILKALAVDAAIFHAEAHLRWLAHAAKRLRRHSSSHKTRSASNVSVTRSGEVTGGAFLAAAAIQSA